MSFIGAAVAGVGIVGSVMSANAQKSAARSAANAQRQASDAAIALQREQWDYARGLADPYMADARAADTMLDARWNVSPATASANAAYGAQPGGPYGPALASGPPQTSVYGGAAQPVRALAGGAPQVQVPLRPAAPAPPAAPQSPWWQAIQFSGPPLPNYAPPPPANADPPVTNQRAPNPNLRPGGAFSAYGEYLPPNLDGWARQFARRQVQ